MNIVLPLLFFSLLFSACSSGDDTPLYDLTGGGGVSIRLPDHPILPPDSASRKILKKTEAAGKPYWFFQAQTDSSAPVLWINRHCKGFETDSLELISPDYFVEDLISLRKTSWIIIMDSISDEYGVSPTSGHIILDKGGQQSLDSLAINTRLAFFNSKDTSIQTFDLENTSIRFLNPKGQKVAWLEGSKYIKNYSGARWFLRLFDPKGDSLYIYAFPPVHGSGMRKPILYLYPEEATDVQVRLDLDGQITHSYPRYPSTGWSMQAQSNGELIDPKTGKSYYALYWEAEDSYHFPIQTGFVVPGRDTEAFLDSALAEIGLNRREAQEFVMYWLPELEKNNYNLIHFAQDEYSKRNRLHISPEPQSLLRLLMVYSPLQSPIDLAKQVFAPFERKGFTAVEWGGKYQALFVQ